MRLQRSLLHMFCLIRKVCWLVAGVAFQGSLHASNSTEVQPITQWSVTDKPTIAKISHAANLIVYMNQGVGTLDASVTLREIGSGDIRCRWDSQGAPGYQTFSPDGSMLLADISTRRSRNMFSRMINAGAMGHHIPYIFDTTTCAPIRSLLLDKGIYSGLRFSDDGQYLLGVRWKRRYSKNDSLFKSRLDRKEPKKQYHPHPPQVGVYYPLHQKDIFLVSRRMERNWKVVSLYTRSNSSEQIPKTRWWTRKSRGENVFVETKKGPTYYRQGFIVAPDRVRFALHSPYADYFSEPTDVYAVIYDAATLEESHRWFFYKSRQRNVMHTGISFFPQTSELVLSLSLMGTVVIHRLLPEHAKPLLRFDTGIEAGFIHFSHDGEMFVVSGKVRDSADEHRILIYRTLDLGINM